MKVNFALNLEIDIPESGGGAISIYINKHMNYTTLCLVITKSFTFLMACQT